MGKIELHPDNTIRFRDPEITRADTGAALTDNELNSVEAEVLDASGGSSLETVTLTHDGSGEWSGILNADHSLSEGDRVDVKFVADGGPSLKGTWWRRHVRVTERMVP